MYVPFALFFRNNETERDRPRRRGALFHLTFLYVCTLTVNMYSLCFYVLYGTADNAKSYIYGMASVVVFVVSYYLYGLPIVPTPSERM